MKKQRLPLGIKEPEKGFPASLLKSATQKAIRRGVVGSSTGILAVCKGFLKVFYLCF